MEPSSQIRILFLSRQLSCRAAIAVGLLPKSLFRFPAQFQKLDPSMPLSRQVLSRKTLHRPNEILC